MAGEALASVGDGFSVGPPNLGLSPERIQEYNQQARVRIAAENAAKEVEKAQRAQHKADLKAKKLAARGGINGKDDARESDVTEDWSLKEQKQEKKGFSGFLKSLLKKKENDVHVVR